MFFKRRKVFGRCLCQNVGEPKHLLICSCLKMMGGDSVIECYLIGVKR